MSSALSLRDPYSYDCYLFGVDDNILLLYYRPDNISTKNLSIKCFKVIFIYFGPSDLRKNPKILKKTFFK